jgi:hypothetical protein
MWRKWLAPNNASKQHIEFNSAFKGLMWIESYQVNHHAIFSNYARY